MIITQAIADDENYLSEAQVIDTLNTALSDKFSNQRILVLIPDHTRSLPLPFLFRVLVNSLRQARQVDFMVALGTHVALSRTEMNELVGISEEERKSKYINIGFLNHSWNDPSQLTTLGTIEKDQIKQIAGEYWHSSLPDHVNVRVNKAILDYDHILILGPTFPHEVVGFSGGEKYLFPGISGAEMINATHWLGALAGVVKTIGIKYTPVREMINVAAEKISTPITLIGLTVEGNDIRGIFIGDLQSAWSAAADLSAATHIHWCEKPFQRVLSCAPTMYDELWTAGKAMYKLEPAVAVGGEVIIYAPHLDTISHVHGVYINEAGYHILPYFLQNWDRYKHLPLGVLAHCSHLRGSGVMENGIEKPNVKVTLASKVSAEECARINLGYADPASIRASEWENREANGILYVPKAGEVLYRVEP